MAEFLSFFYSHKDPFDALGPRQIPCKLVFPEISVTGHLSAYCVLHLSITAVTSACAGKQRRGSTTGRLLCRRRFPWRRRLTLTCVGSKVRVHGWCSSGLNGPLCVTTGTSSNPRLRRVTPEKKESGAELRPKQTPVVAPSLITSFSYFSSFLTPFFTVDHFPSRGHIPHAAFFEFDQVSTSHWTWFLKN